MFHIRRILFPSDLSECSGWAYAYAARVAARFDADLDVLHIRLVGPKNQAELGLISHADEEFCLPLVEGLRETVREVDAPSAPDAIVRYAEEHDVDLIVMGARGRSGFDLPSLGHVAEAVIRSGPCPVLTVRERMPESEFRRVVVPLDFSEPSRVTLAHAKWVAAWFGARLDLLHVVSAPVLAPAPNREPLRLGSSGGPPELERKLRCFAAAVPGPEVASAAHVGTGTPAARIVAFARQIRSDLIVIGTHGETGRRHVRMGGVAEKVVRAAPCPVLTIKSFGKHLLSWPGPATATAAATG